MLWYVRLFCLRSDFIISPFYVSLLSALKLALLLLLSLPTSTSDHCLDKINILSLFSFFVCSFLFFMQHGVLHSAPVRFMLMQALEVTHILNLNVLILLLFSSAHNFIENHISIKSILLLLETPSPILPSHYEFIGI